MVKKRKKNPKISENNKKNLTFCIYFVFLQQFTMGTVKFHLRKYVAKCISLRKPSPYFFTYLTIISTIILTCM